MLPRATRRVLVNGQSIAGELGELAELVSAGGTGVTDGHIRRLLAAGHSADEVFECVVAAPSVRGCNGCAVERLLQDCRP